MVTKLKMFLVIAVANVLLAAASAAAHADEIPLVTGQQWVQSSDLVKKSYLIGIANIVQVELAYEGGNSPRDEQTVVPRFARGLRGETLDSVRSRVDQWYASHPDQLQRPVIETIWFEMVLPGLARNK
jgi:hypothetical protein